MALSLALRKLAYRRLLPQTHRDSSKAVCTVTSRAASATQSATLRTEEPISRPTSQQAVTKRSVATRRPASCASGSSSNTSTSE